MVSACGSSNVDARRLAVLSHDPLATSEAPGTTPWLEREEAGSGNGIGFGGTSPTVVLVVRRLRGPRSSVTRTYAEIAIRSGWLVNSIRCTASDDLFAASKQFPGWVATAVVGVGITFKGAPAVTINFETDYHGRRSATVLTPTPVKPLTVQALADTCLGAS